VITKNIILLHGWTYKKKKLSSLARKLANKGFKVFFPTLPGFGSEKLKRAWTLDDYVAWLRNFILKNKIEKMNLVGHSFGGQIAVKFALLYPTKVESLVLISAAVVRRKPSLHRKFIIFTSKAFGSIFKCFPFNAFYEEVRFLIYKLVGEADYYKAYPFLQKTMVNVLSENLEKDLSRISLPTLILWGKKDKTTRLKIARIAKKKIPYSKLVIFKKANHALPYNQASEVAEEIVNFVKNQK